jgi:hypothetical protein
MKQSIVSWCELKSCKLADTPLGLGLLGDSQIQPKQYCNCGQYAQKISPEHLAALLYLFKIRNEPYAARTMSRVRKQKGSLRACSC